MVKAEKKIERKIRSSSGLSALAGGFLFTVPPGNPTIHGI